MLVVGHSNTLPQIISALGISSRVIVAESDYDNLFLVVLDSRRSSSISTIVRLENWLENVEWPLRPDQLARRSPIGAQRPFPYDYFCSKSVVRRPARLSGKRTRSRRAPAHPATGLPSTMSSVASLPFSIVPMRLSARSSFAALEVAAWSATSDGIPAATQSSISRCTVGPCNDEEVARVGAGHEEHARAPRFHQIAVADFHRHRVMADLLAKWLSFRRSSRRVRCRRATPWSSTCWTNERLSRSVFPLLKSVNPSATLKVGSKAMPFASISAIVASGISSRNEPCSIESAPSATASITSRLSPVWMRCRQLFGVRFLHDGAEQIEIHPVKGMTRHTGFEDSLDRVHAFRRQLVDLLARFLLRFSGCAEIAHQNRRARTPAFASSIRCRVRLPR